MGSLRSILAAPTYARARLLLGMGGVGAFVVLSLGALGLGVPARMFGGKGGGLFDDASLLAVWLAGVALLGLPLEVLGGQVLPRRFGRAAPDVGEWALGWLRGVLVLALVMSFSGALMIWCGRYGGRVGAIGMFGVIVVVLASFQAQLAQLVGGLRRKAAGLESVEDELRRLGVVAPPIRVFESTDEGFTGGISGAPTAEVLVVPRAWVERFGAAELALLIARRTAIVDGGLRALGLSGAVGWTILMFGISTFLPGAGVGSVEAFVGSSLWFTVFSFVGLLVLPTPSRAASLAADGLALEGRPGAKESFAETLRTLDRLQDDEPERSEKVERTFHPIPSLSSRLQALDEPRTEAAPWHLARTALLLSIAGMNPLSRLVHCNVGRPELWVLLPADG